MACRFTGSQFLPTRWALLLESDNCHFSGLSGGDSRCSARHRSGVSGFQLKFFLGGSAYPGRLHRCIDRHDPAALKVNVGRPEGERHRPSSTPTASRKATCARRNPDQQSPGGPFARQFRVFPVELQRLTRSALQHLGLDAKAMDRCKTSLRWACATGCTTARWSRRSAGCDDKFKKKPLLAEANKLAFEGPAIPIAKPPKRSQISYEIPPAQLSPGLYRNLSGNQSPGAWVCHGGEESRSHVVPGQLSDYARFGYPARAFAVQGLSEC